MPNAGCITAFRTEAQLEHHQTGRYFHHFNSG
jgi:hypothetical protein